MMDGIAVARRPWALRLPARSALTPQYGKVATHPENHRAVRNRVHLIGCTCLVGGVLPRLWDCPAARARSGSPRMGRVPWPPAERAGPRRPDLVSLRAFRALRQFPACLFRMRRSPAAARKGCAASQVQLRESAPQLPGMR